MIKLSTGEDSTLGNYKKLVESMLGLDSPALLFLNEKIKNSDKKEDEEVLADEGQMVYLLMNMHFERNEQ